MHQTPQHRSEHVEAGGASAAPTTPVAPVSDSQERHFKTDHLMKNLGRRAASGGVITAGAQAIKFALYLGSAIVLARLLSPRDFGLVAMAGALMPLLRTFREGGLSTATVQKENITHAQVSNLFWINLGLGGLMALIGSLLAPAVAMFYRDERVTVVTILLSLSFLISGTAVQHLALLNRQMRFAAVAGVDIASGTTGFVAGVTMAMTGFGYWSLIGMQLTTTLTEAVLAWILASWRPQLPRRGTDMRSLLKFGASMTVDNFLRRLTSGLDVILLGRFYGAIPVGLYSRATALLLRPLDQFITPFDIVFIPILARLQDQPERYRQVFLQAYGAIALLFFTFAGLLMGLSGPVVLVLLGPKWHEVIPIFAWLTIAALYIPLSYAAVWLLTTQGRSRDLLRMGVTIPLLTVFSVSIGLPFGVVGMAAALAVLGVCVRLPVQYLITGKSGPVSRGDLFGVFFRHLPLWAAVAGTAWAVQRAMAGFSPLAQLIVGGASGLVVAAISIACWPALRREAIFMGEKLQGVIRRRRDSSG